MKIEQTPIDGLLVITPDVHGDKRGYFKETFQAERYSELGIDQSFVQDNFSFSCRGVLRGLHYQKRKPQGKLVFVGVGEVFDVAVDIREGSETFGEWFGVYLNDENHKQLWVPPGFAHGFCVTSNTALFSYKCTDYYDPNDEGGVLWHDSEIGIDWPMDKSEIVVSAKDEQYGGLRG